MVGRKGALLFGWRSWARNLKVEPCRGDDILSASSNSRQVRAQSSFMLVEMSFELAVQYSVTVVAISGWNVRFVSFGEASHGTGNAHRRGAGGGGGGNAGCIQRRGGRWST